MLFSGGSSTAKPKKEEKREKRREEKDERYEIQESVFLRWAKYVCDADFVHELKDVGEIRFLSHFAQMITGGSVQLTGNKCDDIDSVFHALVSDPEDPIFQLCIPEIVEGRTKPILKMAWQLIQVYWRRFAPQGAGERKVAEALKDWCLEATAGYQDREEAISITDFTDSWRDGIASTI
ncbi:DYS-1 protein [Aphelenchoides avenae]|nr:DYS-1 protein [Aphelenchus avenae]